MIDKLKPAKAKTREAHEREMAEVADALRRYLVRKKFMEDDADADWTVDGVFRVFAGRQVGGRVVAFMEAALDVWLAFHSNARPREALIAALSEHEAAVQKLRKVISEPGVATYLANASGLGAVFSLQEEPRTAYAANLKHNTAFLDRELASVLDHSSNLRAGLVERRPLALSAGTYGPRGGGPHPHFAFELKRRGFTYKQIALLRGDVPPRKKATNKLRWKDELRRASDAVRQEIERIKSNSSELQHN